MPAAIVPLEEDERIAALYELDVLDTPPEAGTDRIVHLAARLFGAPIAVISLVDRDRQWFKACLGLDACETPREQAFCAHAILSDEALVVPDATRDERFADNPLVLGEPGIRFYCGVPLSVDGGQRIGTLCVIDRVARTATAQQIQDLRSLGDLASDFLKLRRYAHEIDRTNLDLSRSNADLAQFSYAVSHDLRAPLRHISGFLGLLRERLDADLDEESREMFRHIDSASHKMNALVEDLILLCRADAAPEESGAVPVEEGLGDALVLLEGEIRESTADVVVSPLPIVRAARASMTQLFANLIGNAIKYRAPDSPLVVEIEAEARGSEWVISVLDNGIGLSKESCDEVFDIFRRLDPADERGGNGIGLSVCERIVARNGGRIWAEPRESGGTAFRFTVPAAEPDEKGDGAFEDGGCIRVG